MTRHRPILWTVTFLAAGAAVLTAAQTAQLPADINSASLARLPYIQRARLDDAGQKIYDVLPGRGADGSLGGPLAFAAYNPAVAKALFDLHNAAVAGTLSPRARELAIMVACRETNYALEWNGHEPAALGAGIDARTLDVVRRNAALTDVPAADAAIIQFGRQLFTNKKVDSATFAKIVELYGQRGAMDMVAVMNTYAVSGFYAIAVDEHPPAGKSALPPVK
ncbi:MAG TPA: carboxymuconolactone decarboxylase family protein [Terriglobia bacterium]|nr:carboxymuconolactone decarboxylase family protein [Terriglobia bacterium]